MKMAAIAEKTNACAPVILLVKAIRMAMAARITVLRSSLHKDNNNQDEKTSLIIRRRMTTMTKSIRIPRGADGQHEEDGPGTVAKRQSRPHELVPIKEQMQRIIAEFIIAEKLYNHVRFT